MKFTSSAVAILWSLVFDSKALAYAQNESNGNVRGQGNTKGRPGADFPRRYAVEIAKRDAGLLRAAGNPARRAEVGEDNDGNGAPVAVPTCELCFMTSPLPWDLAQTLAESRECSLASIETLGG